MNGFHLTANIQSATKTNAMEYTSTIGHTHRDSSNPVLITDRRECTHTHLHFRADFVGCYLSGISTVREQRVSFPF